MEKILLFYPPGPLFQRGEDRCQQNIDDGSAQAMRACNDLGYGASILLQRNYEVKLRDYQTQKDSIEDLYEDMENFKPDLIMLSVTNTTIFDDIQLATLLKKRYHPVIVLKGAIFYDPPEEMLQLLDLSSIDYMIGGEEDFAIGEVADYALRGEGDIRDVPNILFKLRDGTILRTS